jgi:demethylmenaquinone methyltransferase / 2-methoxy-6-polyprenyl-1,4-benzoquinol methylase
VSLPAADERNRFAQRLFAPLPARYDQLAEVLSFGQNGRWRRAMVDHITAVAPANGAAPAVPDDSARNKMILDVAAGTAGVSIQIARRTAATVIGVDLTEQMLRQGRQNVAEAGQASRISLVAGRAEQLPFPDATFDALTFTYLLRYVDDPQATLAELARVVKPGGLVASLEFLAPPSPFWRFWWWLYTRLALPAGGLLTGGTQWYGVGRFLGPSISGHYRRYPVDWTAEAWRRAGLRDVGVREMSLGGGLVMWGTRASE